MRALRQEPQDLTAKGQMMRTLSGPGPELQGDAAEGGSNVALFSQNWQELPRSSLHNSSSDTEDNGRGKPGMNLLRAIDQT